MKKTKKLISAAIAAVLLLASVQTVFAQNVNTSQDELFNFSQFRGNSAVVDSRTPITADNTTEKFAKKFGNTWNDTPGTPIIAGDSVYCLVAGQKKVYRLDKETGDVTAAADCDGAGQYFSYIAYGDGKIFVPRTVKVGSNNAAVVYAYDALTLEMLWVSDYVATPEDGATALGNITYNDGYIYVGVSNSKAENGAVACFKTEDTDASRSDETQAIVWRYKPEDGLKSGYYWAGATVVGNAALIAGEAAELVSHGLTNDTVFDRMILEENSKGVRSAVCFDETTRRIYAVSKSGFMYSVVLNPDNTFDKASLKSVEIGGSLTSSPVVFGGRVYVGGGGMSGKAGFTVINAETLEIIYQVTDIKSQSSPIITTAYANEDNGNEIFAYLTDFKTSELYAVSDCEGQTEPSYEKIAVPSATQYCSQSVSIDKQGKIYYYNDSGSIFCFAEKNETEYTAKDVENQIKLYSAKKITAGSLTALKHIKARLNDLEDQSAVSNAAALDEMLAKAEALNNQYGIIEKLNAETAGYDFENTEDYEKVSEWSALYYSLSEENCLQVKNSAPLIKALNRLQAVKDREAAAALNAEIDSLPSTEQATLKYLSAVEALKNKVEMQTDAVKNLVNLEKLDAVLQYLKAVKKDVEEINSDIVSKIDPLNITLADKDTVTALLARYNALSDDNKKFVTESQALLYADSVIKDLENGKINSDVFENLYGTNKDYTYNGKGFTIKFNGNNITDINDFNVGGIEIKSDLNGTYVKVPSGLPGKAEITAETELKDGYYDLIFTDENGKQSNIGRVKVENSRFSFTAEKAGTYSIAATTSPKTADSFNASLFAALLLISALIAVSASERLRKSGINK